MGSREGRVAIITGTGNGLGKAYTLGRVAQEISSISSQWR
jgi:NAD(P)-dependent dehydrogenase (short-subunit alcohol dehydrogenase family)